LFQIWWGWNTDDTDKTDLHGLKYEARMTGIKRICTD